MWLFGEHATGKSHVLRALARETVASRYIKEHPPSLDEDVVAPLLLIDDIDLLCGDEESEYALFAAYEATDFTKTRWVVSAHSAPNEVSFLISRFSIENQSLRACGASTCTRVGESEPVEILGE